MSEQRPIGSAVEAAPPKTFVQKLLDGDANRAKGVVIV